MTTAVTEPLADTTTGGVTTVDLTHATRGTRRRLPSVLALAQATGGLYAESLTGMSVPKALEAAGLDFAVAAHGPLSVLHTGRRAASTFPWPASITRR